MLLVNIQVSTPENEIPKKYWFDEDNWFHFYLTVPNSTYCRKIYSNIETRNFVDSLRLVGDPDRWIRALIWCVRKKNCTIEFLKDSYEKGILLSLDESEEISERRDYSRKQYKYSWDVDGLRIEFLTQLENMMVELKLFPRDYRVWFRWGTDKYEKIWI